MPTIDPVRPLVWGAAPPPAPRHRGDAAGPATTPPPTAAEPRPDSATPSPAHGVRCPLAPTRLLASPLALAVAAGAGRLRRQRARPAAPPAARSTVESTDDGVRGSSATAPVGHADASRCSNTGDEVTEFYLLGDDGLRIVGEVENIGPGLTRDLVVRPRPGSYFTVVQAGHGRRRDPAPRSPSPDSGARSRPPATTRRSSRTRGRRLSRYVKDQAGHARRRRRRRSPTRTRRATTTRPARLYAPARVHWERIEPVAESFGDLDPLIDLREADVGRGPDVDRLAPHREGPVAAAPTRTAASVRAADAGAARDAADDLVANTQELVDKVTRRTSRSRRSRSPTARRSCSTRSRPARSPARRRSGRTPTCGTSRPTSTARRSAFEVLRDVVAGRGPGAGQRARQRFDALEALLAEQRLARRRLHALRRAHAGRGQGSWPPRSTR